MTDRDFAHLAEIVADALDQPADAREPFLDAVCVDADGTPDMRLRVEAAALVDASVAADETDALRSPLASLDAGLASGIGADAPLPERVGPWRVTGLLGEGGMGVVYRARRADGTLDRDVALKRLHPALGRALAGRLDAERDALARLEHDGVARLYDAGVDETGAPFLVMELVDGQPLTDHAEAAGLDVRARVALFAQVCDAVAYAHQRLLVHRDLKPSNVFVTTAEGQAGRVKLLDFGIAKVLGEAGAGALAETLTRTQAALTPSYAAPEQIRRGEITTATDVYALGVMLYELLAGRRPYALSGTTPAEAERIVCEADPPPPSAAAPAERARALRGDLDRIVGKAMAKEPGRRYASAEALGDDLRRFLTGLPVRARRPTRAYRARRFVRRHRAGAAATVLVFLALVGGTAVALWQAREARAEATRATAVSDFLVGLLAAADPTGADGRDVRVADLLDRAAADVDSAFAGQPATRAQMHHTLGTTYLELGLYDEAETHLARAADLRARIFGPDDRETLDSQRWLGETWLLQDETERADSLLTRALASARRTLPDDDLLASHLLSAIGYVRFLESDYEASLAAHRESVEIQQAQREPDQEQVAVGLGNMAVVLENLGRGEEAAPVQERQLAIYRRTFGTTHARTARVLDNLGTTYSGLGRNDDALRVASEAVAVYRNTVPPDSPELAGALSNLGPVLTKLERHAEAEAALREALGIFVRTVGPEHRRAMAARRKLGQALWAQGRRAEGEALVREALAGFDAAFPDGHPARSGIRVTLGRMCLETGRGAEAVGLLTEAVRIADAALPDGHPDRVEAARLLAEARAQR